MRNKPDKIKQGEQFPKQFCLTGATTDEFEQIVVKFYHTDVEQSVVFVKVPDPAYPDASIIDIYEDKVNFHCFFTESITSKMELGLWKVEIKCDYQGNISPIWKIKENVFIVRSSEID